MLGKTAAVLVALLAAAPAFADVEVELAPPSQWRGMGLGKKPELTVGGVVIEPGGRARVPAPAEGRLASAVLRAGSLRLAFLVELRDGHRYEFFPDPCCFLTVLDEDDPIAPHARCGDASCPTGTREVDEFVYRDERCAGRITCAPPARLRVKGRGAVAISFDGDEPSRFGARWQEAPSARESPQHVVVTVDGKAAWEGDVVLLVGHRYTLALGGGGPRWSVDGGMD